MDVKNIIFNALFLVECMYASDNIIQLQQAVNAVLKIHYANLGKLLEGRTLQHFAREMYAKEFITEDDLSSPSYDAIMMKFKTGIKLKRTLSKLEKICADFIEILKSLGGFVSEVAEHIKNDWLLNVPQMKLLDC